MKLVFDVNPCSKGRPRLSTRGGFARAYTPAKTRHAETELQILARQQWKQPPLTGALHVAINFYVPVKNKKLWGTPHDKRPDIDNYTKLLFDSVQGIVIEDDGQIAHLDAQKFYAEKGKIELYIYQIKNRP